MSLLTKSLLLLMPGVLCASQCMAQSNTGTAQGQGVVLSDVPQKIDTNALYLFYISGYIVEAGNTRPTSPRFGVYEYKLILHTFKQSGFVVISEARKQTSEIEPYAKKVAEQVRRLLKAGVPPQNITVVGASQGSFMAMLVSTYLENRNTNFVLIAACAAEDGLLQLVNLHGNVLFISEKSDLPALCQRFRADATGLSESKELETNTGQRHGFLYRPMKEWVEPTVAWAQTHSGNSILEQELMRLQHSVDEAETKKDFISASQTQNKRSALNYEPEMVTLSGLLVSRTFYGPPNYGENPKRDTKESEYILILDSPIDVAGDGNDSINKTEQGIKRITLVVHDFKAHPVEPFLGSRIEVSGTLFHAHTGHHHTKVLIEVFSIRRIGKARA